MTRHLILVFFALCVLLPAQEETLIPGLYAPPERWYCSGGSASRSGLSSLFVSTENLVDDWKYKSEFGIASAPRAWDQNVIVVEKTKKPGRMQLKILDVDSGDVILKSPAFPSMDNPEVCVWGRIIIVQTSSDELTFFRVGYTKITKGRRFSGKGKIDGFLLYQGVLYITHGTTLGAYKPASLAKLWVSERGHVGPPSVLGDYIYTMGVSSDEVVLLVHSLKTGDQLTYVPGRLPAQGIRGKTKRPGRVQVTPKAIVVQLPIDVSHPQGGVFNSIFFRSNAIDQPKSIAFSSAAMMNGRAVPYDGLIYFFGSFSTAVNGLLAANAKDGSFLEVVENSERKDLFVNKTEDCLLCGNSFWFSDCSFTVPDRKLIRSGGDKDVGTPIPVKDGYLFTTNGGKGLRVMRDARYKTRQLAQRIGSEKGSIENGRAFLRSGKIVSGNLEYDFKEDRLARIRSNGKKQNYELKDVLLVEDDKSKVVMSHSQGTFELGMRWAMSHQFNDLYLKLANDSIKTGDLEFVANVIEKATLIGVEEKDLSKVRKKFDRLKKKKKLKSKPDLVKKISATEKDESKKIFDSIWQRMKGLPSDTPKQFRVELLRRLFESDPQHKEATALVKSWLPKSLQNQEIKNPIDWLDFIVAADQIDITIVRPPTKDQQKTTWDERQLGITQRSWRKDITGVRSKRLLVITPLSNPSQVARCLAMGETVCDALDEIFKGGKRVRSKSRPLVIHLFGTRDSYVKFGLKRGMRNVGSTLGYYSPGENITRLFFPDSEAQLEQMYGTFVHELTHHWTFARCPLFGAADAARLHRPNPGAWVIEGFAEMMSEFIYDPNTGKFTVENPRAASLDIVANATKTQLIGWKTFLGMRHGHLLALGKKPLPHLSVKLRWIVGGAAFQSPTNVFYAQSGALCHFLLRANNGEYRDELLQFVKMFYEGKTMSWGPEKYLGMTPNELGRAVQKFAREQSRQ